MSELEGRGIQVFTTNNSALLVGAHRTLDPEQATARVLLANADWIPKARKKPRARQIADADYRTAEQREEYGRILLRLREALQELGAEDRAARVGLEIKAAYVPGMKPGDSRSIARLFDIGIPAAVFLIPPG